jgi:hypothetical protein
VAGGPPGGLVGTGPRTLPERWSPGASRRRPVQGRFLRTAVVRATQVAAFSTHVLLRDPRGSALVRRVAHDRLLSDAP